MEMVNNNEIWLDVKGYEGLYMVSNLGRVKSIERVVDNNGVKQKRKSMFLKIIHFTGGYLKCTLFKNGVRESSLVHRIVALSFIENPDNKPQVNHINGIKSDNRVENLEWANASENAIHAVKNKLRVAVKGSKHYSTRLNEVIVSEIRAILKIHSSSQVSKMYSIPLGTILDIQCRRTWKHVS